MIRPAPALALAATALACGLAAPLHAQSSAPAVPAVVEEVPFVTSPDNVTLEMLRIARVGAKDHVIDLGSGDGRIVITAARQFGATGLGVEIDPTLVERSIRTAREAGVSDKVDFRVQDLFKTDLSGATVVTMYLLPQVNLQLRPALLQLEPGTRIVSHDWDMGDWKPDRTTVVPVPDKKVGREKSSRIHLWTVPARVDGTWCGQGEARAARLVLRQTHQMLGGTLSNGKRSKPLDGRLEGTRIQASPALVLAQDGRSIRLSSGDAGAGLAPGTRFVRAGASGCTG